MSEASPAYPPPNETLLDAALTENELYDYLHNREASLTPDRASLVVAERAINEPTYHAAATNLLANPDTYHLSEDEQHILREGLFIPIPTVASTTELPRNFEDPVRHNVQFNRVMKDVMRVVDHNKNMLLGSDRRREHLEPERKNRIETASAVLKDALERSPEQIALVLRQRARMARNVEQHLDRLTTAQRETVLAQARAEADRTLPQPPDPNVHTLYGPPWLRGSNPDGSHRKIPVPRSNRWSLPERGSWEDTGLQRFQSKNRMARRRHAEQTREILGRDIALSRAEMALEDLEEDLDGDYTMSTMRDYQAFEEVLAGVPQLAGRQEAINTLGEHFHDPAELDSLLRERVEEQTRNPNPQTEAELFNLLNESSIYTMLIDEALEDLSPFHPDYRRLYDLRQNMITIHFRNRYWHENQRIAEAQATGNNFRNQYAAARLGDDRIALDHYTIIYGDGRYTVAPHDSPIRPS